MQCKVERQSSAAIVDVINMGPLQSAGHLAERDLWPVTLNVRFVLGTDWYKLNDYSTTESCIAGRL